MDVGYLLSFYDAFGLAEETGNEVEQFIEPKIADYSIIYR